MKLLCSFCDKSQREVKSLIAGRVEGVFMCDECVGQALIILCADGWVPPTVTLKVSLKLSDAEPGKADIEEDGVDGKDE